jgi:transposase
MSSIVIFTDYHSYYLYEGPVSMRKSFDGLCGIVTNVMQRQLKDKEVYIFLNKQLTHIKILLHERGGFTLFYRRLDKGRFTLPSTTTTDGTIVLSASELLSMIRGLTLHQRKNTGIAAQQLPVAANDDRPGDPF